MPYRVQCPDYTTVNERFNGASWTTRRPSPCRTPRVEERLSALTSMCRVDINSIDFGGPLDTMQIYDTVADSWSQGMVLPAARSGVATATFNGLVYVIGGYNPVGTGHNDVYIYDPVANSYTMGAPMPAARVTCPGSFLTGRFTL